LDEFVRVRYSDSKNWQQMKTEAQDKVHYEQQKANKILIFVCIFFENIQAITR
jgi:hypothetical protein